MKKSIREMLNARAMGISLLPVFEKPIIKKNQRPRPHQSKRWMKKLEKENESFAKFSLEPLRMKSIEDACKERRELGLGRKEGCKCNSCRCQRNYINSRKLHRWHFMTAQELMGPFTTIGSAGGKMSEYSKYNLQ